ncbi:hypothetical protein SPONN_1446 [uncultured Candidatus Thioglobus sp.]|nr:hypothetical protein SPONN_1446 [uncultured Candidatus Thioglobus sp.]SMN01509.1 hypothetical protein SPONL_2054 [uncultured Candidatus Thioglobus sp.]
MGFPDKAMVKRYESVCHPSRREAKMLCLNKRALTRNYLQVRKEHKDEFGWQGKVGQ